MKVPPGNFHHQTRLVNKCSIEAGRYGTAMEDEVGFGPYGPFLEDSVKHILKHKPAAIGVCGVLADGFIGAYYEASIADKMSMAGNILLDIFMDFIKGNTTEIKAILDSAEDFAVENNSDGG